MEKRIYSKAMVLIILMNCAIHIPASAKGDTSDMYFHGTLITPPPCTINNGQNIEVNFGDRVGVGKVDGVNYRTPLNYQITCEKSDSSWVMLMTLTGTAASFDAESLQSNLSDLGVRVYRNDVPFIPNSTVDVIPANPPRLEVVPVKKEGVKLTEGTFEAWATLQVEYL